MWVKKGTIRGTFQLYEAADIHRQTAPVAPGAGAGTANQGRHEGPTAFLAPSIIDGGMGTL